jgi:hypothetical protein
MRSPQLVGKQLESFFKYGYSTLLFLPVDDDIKVAGLGPGVVHI